MDDLIDQALRDDDAGPASSFRADVMRRVRADVDTPPLPFPWRLVFVMSLAGGIAGAFLQF